MRAPLKELSDDFAVVAHAEEQLAAARVHKRDAVALDGLHVVPHVVVAQAYEAFKLLGKALVSVVEGAVPQGCSVSLAALY